MKISFFKTAKPKRFTYRPRYYDPVREEREKRRLIKGAKTPMSEEEELRMKIREKWHPGKDGKAGSNRYAFFIYGIIIIGGVYLIFFTGFIENLMSAFGVVR